MPAIVGHLRKIIKSSYKNIQFKPRLQFLFLRPFLVVK